MNSYGANNNSVSSPQFVLKMSIITFLFVQAVRQLILVNAQYDAKTETRGGQVATWMTIVLTLAGAALLYPRGNLERKTVLGGLFVLFAGIMGSGIAMVYTSTASKDISQKAEKNRRWFGIAHIIFAAIILTFLLYSLI
jgi:hypothetical protein